MTPDHKKALEKNLEKAARKAPPVERSEEEERFDKALMESFPASDPPEQTGPHNSIKRDDAASEKLEGQKPDATTTKH